MSVDNIYIYIYIYIYICLFFFYLFKVACTLNCHLRKSEVNGNSFGHIQKPRVARQRECKSVE